MSSHGNSENQHWILSELFTLAQERVWTNAAIAAAILEETGREYPVSSIRYWRDKRSVPNIQFVDDFAAVLGYELELMLTEKL